MPTLKPQFSHGHIPAELRRGRCPSRQRPGPGLPADLAALRGRPNPGPATRAQLTTVGKPRKARVLGI